MDIRVLEYFLMIAREQNITKAAQLLHVTQPTLSRQLTQLEEELGVRLFTRSNHSIALTDEGELFLRRAQDMVEIAERAKQEISQKGENVSGIIAIGCSELRSMRELAQIMADFQERFPQVKFEVYSGSNEEISMRMESGMVDVGLFLQPVNLEKCTVIPMKTKERWGVLTHKDAPLAACDTVRPADLPRASFFIHHVSTPEPWTLAQWAGDFAKGMNFNGMYNTLYNAVIVARERKGAVICLEPDCHYDDMKFLPLEPPLIAESVLAWKDGQAISKAVKLFLYFLEERLL